ncbi:DUF6254 family protein [Bacillus carboniphilus]|uniref:DUF6254 family protein n=1 Tax=Bacillus carboniphilus TaxID=86663 RepID=A0ABY9JZW6_9BACI|nr:DUF6254 family protein [Bacillus carboniphilus]WLR43145.1 DUF6254 family protein [Bacillus carboniphilus]
MSQSKHEKERQWNVRKGAQHEHGKVKSFDQIEKETSKKQK